MGKEAFSSRNRNDAMQQAISLLLNYTILGLGVDDGEKCSRMPGGNTTWKAGETGLSSHARRGVFFFLQKAFAPCNLGREQRAQRCNVPVLCAGPRHVVFVLTLQAWPSEWSHSTNLRRGGRDDGGRKQITFTRDNPPQPHLDATCRPGGVRNN